MDEKAVMGLLEILIKRAIEHLNNLEIIQAYETLKEALTNINLKRR